jgi:hypothetical protein
VSKLQHQRKQAKEKGERGPVQIPSKGRGERFTACPITTSWRTGEQPRNQEAVKLNIGRSGSQRQRLAFFLWN